jgi:ATP-binding cassette subfamily B protein
VKDAWRVLAPFILRYRSRWALGFAALLAKDAAGVVLPLLLRAGVDSLTSRFRFSSLLIFAALMLAISAVKGVFLYWMRVILVGLSRDIEFDLRNELYRRLIAQSAAFYARFRTGDLMARATNDLNAVRMMVGPGVMYWVETSLTFVLALAVMLSTDWLLTVFVLLPAPLVSLAVIFFGQRIHARFEKIQALFSDISSRVQENLAGVRVIRAYVQEDAELATFGSLNRAYIAQNLRLVRLSGLFYPLLQALVGLTFLLVLYAGGRRVLSGHITLGGFVMFNTYLGMLVWPMIAFGWVINLMQRGRASLGRIREILEAAPAIAAPSRSTAAPAGPAAIEFDRVTLVYDGRKALDDVSLRLEPGETVAVVGRTGSGKSSLVHLIPRLADPSSGAVRLGGIDLRDLDPAGLRRRVGFVPQETFLFSSTLAANIAFGVDDASPEQILRAAGIAGLSADLDAFPQGLDTLVGERGITLSGGQKQRTAIARALLRDPEILILDDALSSVDTLTEEQILRGLAGLLAGRTTILISHRVSTVRHASRIFVLDQGRIVEQGSHDSLVALGGYYADLHRRQLLEEELEAI